MEIKNANIIDESGDGGSYGLLFPHLLQLGMTIPPLLDS